MQVREEVAEPSSVQILFDTWRASTNPAIRRNCALTLAHLYGGTGAGPGEAVPPMPHDDLLLPLLGLATPEASDGELDACVAALARRALLPGRPLDVVFLPSLIAGMPVFVCSSFYSYSTFTVRFMQLSWEYCAAPVERRPRRGRLLPLSCFKCVTLQYPCVGANNTTNAHCRRWTVPSTPRVTGRPTTLWRP